jgi:hypothetical protein
VTESRVVLNYAPPVSSQPRLEERDGSARVIFPVQPRWVYVLQIVWLLLAGCMEGAILIMIPVMLWNLWRRIHRPFASAVAADLRLIPRAAVIQVCAYATLCWAAATYEWWRYWRWGRVPRVLTATSAGLVQTRLGLWRMRERRWPADQFAAVDLKMRGWTVPPKRTAAILFLHRRRGRALHFRLSTVDSQLPARIAQQLASILGCPLK